MFSSIVNIPLPSATPTLVATTLPNSSALRVPYDNVAPSVSSAQLDNNASANRNFTTKTNILPQPLPSNGTEEKFSFNQAGNSIYFSPGAQTAFLAQLASGDISAEVHGIFVQYEKLVSYANVKYKPSNAGKPADNAGLFSTLLQLEKSGASHVTQAASPVISPPVFEPAGDNEPQQAITATAASQETPPEKEVPLSRLNAYSASITRNLDATPAELESA
jgi:hypothetical protein